jgi:glutathione S-transferase
MQAYLRFKRIPFRQFQVSWTMMARKILPATGLMEVPVIQRPDGSWMRDSTAMIEWFEQRYPARRILPGDPEQAFLCFLLEDYADEWLWPRALHYRWSYPKDRWLAARRFTEDLISHRPRWLTRYHIAIRQYLTYVRGEGITRETRAQAEYIYRRELAHLQKIFAVRPFLLGDRPCLADFGYFASMFRHFSLDPTPQRIMIETAPAVYEWVARMWNSSTLSDGNPHWIADPEVLHQDWSEILTTIGRTYLPYLAANAKAISDDDRCFDTCLDDVPYRGLRTNLFRAYCRHRLQSRYETLPPEAKTTLRQILDETGCWTPLMQFGRLGHSCAGADNLPECKPYPVGTLGKIRNYMTGTPRHARTREQNRTVPAIDAFDPA